MEISPTTCTLKDGRTCLIRPAQPGDAGNIIAFMVLAAAESTFLVSYPDEISLNKEYEAAFIDRMNQSEDEMLILADCDGHVAGMGTTVKKNARRKIRHRVELGLTVQKAYWGLGIGRQLIRTLIDGSVRSGLEQIELGVFSDNTRARHLYQEMGFQYIGYTPNAFKLDDKTSLGEYRMRLALNK